MLGNDGNRYTGTYGNGLMGNSFFINVYPKGCISLHQKNNKYSKQISSLVEKDMDSQQFDILVVPCDRAFVVSPDKTEAFLNVKPNPKIRQQQEKIAKKIRLYNLVEKGPVLKKTRKSNIK